MAAVDPLLLPSQQRFSSLGDDDDASSDATTRSKCLRGRTPFVLPPPSRRTSFGAQLPAALQKLPSSASFFPRRSPSTQL
jgi:hypothetical protein